MVIITNDNLTHAYLCSNETAISQQLLSSAILFIETSG